MVVRVYLYYVSNVVTYEIFKGILKIYKNNIKRTQTQTIYIECTIRMKGRGHNFPFRCLLRVTSVVL